jgi:hypothetical protein
MQQMRNPQSFTPFMAWKGLFQHLEGSPMGDHHEFKCAHEIQIEEWWVHWSPNYVSITMRIVAPSGASTTLNISSTNGNESATSNGAIQSGGTIKGGGVGASTSTRGTLPIFNLVVEFFHELRQNYQRVCKISNVSPMRACKKPIHGCVG